MAPTTPASSPLPMSLEKLFATTPDIVDVDNSVEAPAERWIIDVDRSKAALLGVAQAEVANAL